MIKAPAFLFPTETILIDDDITYAHLLIDSMSRCNSISAMDNADIILKQKKSDFIFLDGHKDDGEALVRSCLDREKNDAPNLVSVIVADLHMGSIRGLDIFYQLKSPYIYRILISNFIDERFQEEINEAQNCGAIDVVLQKGRNLKIELPSAIDMGQSKFFTLLSNNLLDTESNQNYLSDTEFAEEFKKLLNTYQPDFVWPHQGQTNFVFRKNGNGESQRVFITTPEENDMLIQSDSAHSAPKKALDMLKSGNHMICHTEPHNLDGNEWPFYLREAKKISGSKNNFLFQIEKSNKE
jgi:hypothetical protein